MGSEDGAALLNKYASDHSNFYGIRPFTRSEITYCQLCTSDNKNIVESGDRWISPSYSDGRWRNCRQSDIDYRPKLCGNENNKSCDLDWTLIVEYEDYSDVCESSSSKMNALFVKTQLYNNFAAVCDFTAKNN